MLTVMTMTMHGMPNNQGRNLSWGWGVSVRGPDHIRRKLPNQDAFTLAHGSWGSLVVLCDGMGSCAYAHIGARRACQAIALTTQIHCCAHLQSQQLQPELLLKQCYKQWRRLIIPYSVAECRTTCLLALLYKEQLLLCQLGDGLLAVDTTQDVLLPVGEEEKPFANITAALGEHYKFADWRCALLPAKTVHAVLLASDGIADDIAASSVSAFVHDLTYAHRSLSPQQSRYMLRRQLKTWPVQGHSDDKTLACMYLPQGEL